MAFHSPMLENFITNVNKQETRSRLYGQDGYKFSVHLAMTSLGAINFVVSE
jgi:hypothetical protein